MKQKLTKISSILLALLVLLSTFSFTVEKLYCGDFLVDVSYLGEANDCGMAKDDGCGITKKKKKCCKSEVYQIDGQDQIQKNPNEKISFQEVKLFVAFYTSYKLLFDNLEKQFVPHEYYSPPDLVFNIQVLHEVFII